MSWSTSPDTVAVLSGLAAVSVGMTFVPESALRELRWGSGGPADLVTAACSRMEPDFVFVPSWKPWADEAADRIAACGTDVFWVVPGPFGLVAERDGWPATLRRTLGDPVELRADMEAEMPAILESTRRGAGLDVRAIVVAEDMAGSSALLFSPDFALDEVLPLLRTVVDVAVEEMVPAVLHSDGDIRAVLRSVRRAGFMGIHVSGGDFERFERLFDAARAAGLGVLGGLETSALGAGTATAMAAGTRAGLIARRGGLLICDDGGITTGAEVAALVAAFEAARRTWDESETVR